MNTLSRATGGPFGALQIDLGGDGGTVRQGARARLLWCWTDNRDLVTDVLTSR
jgi:hypothetical protein